MNELIKRDSAANGKQLSMATAKLFVRDKKFTNILERGETVVKQLDWSEILNFHSF